MANTVYVSRDGSSNITGVFVNQQDFASEQISPTDPAVLGFLNRPGPPLSARIDDSVFQILFNHENRVRVLEGKATITIAQFKAALLTLLGG